MKELPFDMVPSSAIMKLVKPYLETEHRKLGISFDAKGSEFSGEDDPMFPTTALAMRAEMSTSALYFHIQGKRKWIPFNAADRLMCAMGLQHLWYSDDLRDIYLNVKLDPPSLPEEYEGTSCKNGHVRTPENFRKRGVNAVCLACERKAANKKYAERAARIRAKKEAA